MKIDQANKRENFVLRNDAPIRTPKMSENVCVHTFASILISNLDFLKQPQEIRQTKGTCHRCRDEC